MIDAIKEEASRANIELEIFSGKSSYNIEDAKSYKLLISNLTFDDLQNKFNCNIEVFIDNKSFDSGKIMGRFYNMTEVYVPIKEIKKDTLITEDMLKTITIKEGKAKDVFALQKEDIVDREAKKDLYSNALILNKDIQKPTLINRNDNVLVLYKTDKMEIGMKAYAGEDGALGDVITLINPSSKKTIMGKVISKGTVSIEGDK